MQVSAWADWLERADSLSGLCCFPHWPLLRCCFFAVQCRPARVLICAYLAGLVNPTPGLQEKACDRWFWQILVLVTYLAVENGGEAAKRKGKFPCFDFTPRVRKFSLEEGEIMLSWDQQSRRTRPWPLGRGRWKKEGCCSLRGWRSGAERGGNSPLARPQSNVKRHFLEIHSISAEIQKLLGALGLKKKKKKSLKNNQPSVWKCSERGKQVPNCCFCFHSTLVWVLPILKKKRKKKSKSAESRLWVWATSALFRAGFGGNDPGRPASKPWSCQGNSDPFTSVPWIWMPLWIWMPVGSGCLFSVGLHVTVMAANSGYIKLAVAVTLCQVAAFDHSNA